MNENVKQRVLRLCKNDATNKLCYNFLIRDYWERVNFNTPAESITRAFRELVADGEIVLDDFERQIRKDRAADMRAHYRQINKKGWCCLS